MAHPRWLIVLLALCAELPAWAIPVRVIARIEGARREAIPDAIVTVTAGPRVLARDEPILDGRLELGVDHEGAAVVCEFRAAGYRSERRNVPVLSGVANADLVVLQPLPGLVLSDLVVYQLFERKTQFVDVQVKNGSTEQSIALVRFELMGTRRQHTTCIAAAAPAIHFQFTGIVDRNGSRAGPMPMNVTIAGQPGVQKLSARGIFEKLPCDQVRLDLRFEFPFTLAPGEEQKIRLTLPSVLPSHGPYSESLAETTIIYPHSPTAHRHVAPLLALDSWHRLSLSITLGDHRQFTTRLNSSSPQEWFDEEPPPPNLHKKPSPRP